MAAEAFRHYLKIRRKCVREKREREAAHKKRIDDFKAREHRENQEILRQVLGQNAKLADGHLELLSIPLGHSATSRPADDRVLKYSEHLQKLIREASEHPDESNANKSENIGREIQKTEIWSSKNSELQIINDRLCGMCKGGCCTQGGETAYISVRTIRRFMDKHPNLSDDEILDAYLSKIGDETITDACINQTSSGCALPREMRSNTCNRFYCDALKDWHDQPDEKRNDIVLAIQRGNSYWLPLDVESRNQVVDVALIRARDIVSLAFDDP
jgi:hypothetical protein